MENAVHGKEEVKKGKTKFYGVGQVWDKDNKKIMCSFGGTNFDGSGYTIPGAYEADEREAKILSNLGYPTNFEEAKRRLRKADSDKIKEDKKKVKSLKSQNEADEGAK